MSELPDFVIIDDLAVFQSYDIFINVSPAVYDMQDGFDYFGHVKIDEHDFWGYFTKNYFKEYGFRFK